MLKKLLGLNPKPTSDGAYSPSNFALRMSTSDKTNYEQVSYSNKNMDQNKRVLVLCTEEAHLPTANGKQFSSGNHPVETLLPMMHLKDAGFELDIFTPTGKAAKIEMWAMPKEDQKVMDFFNEYKTKLDKPSSVAYFVKEQFISAHEYVAILIPGGHGAIIGLPKDPNVGKLIHWAHDQNKFILSICHGPAAFLSLEEEVSGKAFPFSGYSIAAFPDKMDKQLPMIGYLPGQLTWFFGEKLKKHGMTIVNTKADDTCHVDRRLITAASPKAANAFGKLCAQQLLAHI
ncbi:MAG: DJ-1/PfpI family protein [Saprospiraceae bacterium]|nr:DJ-1/PfpI family protein [Saprospiraceae bacterium]